MIESLIRPHLKAFKPYQSARSHLTDAITFLDANENPLGSPVQDGDSSHWDVDALNRYPDPFQITLRRLLGDYIHMPAESIFVGVGSDEVLDLLIRLFCNPNHDEIIILEPTYGVYSVAAQLNDIPVTSIELDESFHIPVDKVKKAIRPQTKMIFCCSPNNPTGNLLHKEDILECCKEFHGIMVVDEAYIEFANQPSMVTNPLPYENLVMTRTLSKAWGLAGIRLGYGIAHPKIVEYLLKIKAPYNINKVTAALASTSLNHRGFMEQSVVHVRQERSRIAETLSSLSIVKWVYPSDANFILARFDNAEHVYQTLLKEKIIVRMRSEPRLKDCLRITIGSREENDHVLSVITSI